MRVKFRKGKQKEFLKLVISRLDSPSLRALRQFGVSASYDCLKNYFSERRFLPRELFEDLCVLAGLNGEEFGVVFLEENFGRVKGGRKSRK